MHSNDYRFVSHTRHMYVICSLCFDTTCTFSPCFYLLYLHELYKRLSKGVMNIHDRLCFICSLYCNAIFSHFYLQVLYSAVQEDSASFPPLKEEVSVLQRIREKIDKYVTCVFCCIVCCVSSVVYIVVCFIS